MAQHYWTAEDYAVGENPPEWTVLANAEITIAQDTSGTNFLEIRHPSDSIARSIVSFDPAGDVGETEVWARFKAPSSTDNFISLRMTNGTTPSTLDAARVDYLPRTSTDRISEYANGGFSELSAQGLTTPAGTIGHVRGRVIGNTLSARWWTDGNAEPSTMQLSGTTTVSSTGGVGACRTHGGGFHVYEYGVGTAGDAAPTEPVSTTTTVTGPPVTLDGTVIQGAIITVIDNASGAVLGETTTDVDGNWSIEADPGQTVHVLAEYEDADGNLHRETSKPFVVT